MTIAGFKDALQAQRFNPFVAHVGGHVLEVTHPEQVLLAEGGATAIIVTPDDHFHIVDVSEINRLEIKNRQAA